MVTATFVVQKNQETGAYACGQCGAEVPLFILHLTPGEEPRLEPKPKETHVGICEDCWGKVGVLLTKGVERDLLNG